MPGSRGLPKTGGQLARALPLAVLALGLGCLLAYARAFAPEFQGALPFTQDAAASDFSFTCSFLRMAGIACAVAAALLFAGGGGSRGGGMQGETRERLQNRVAVAVAVAMAAAACLMIPGWGIVANFAGAALAGITSGVAMLAFMMALSARSLNQIVAVCLGALVMGGLLIFGLMRLDAVLSQVLLAVCGAAAPTCFLVATLRGGGRSMLLVGGAAGKAPGSIRRGADSGFPWFPVLIFAASGFTASLLYGVAVSLGWDMAGPVNYPLFGLAIAVVVGATAFMVANGALLLGVAWFPLFALLLAAMVLASFADADVNRTVIALLMAGMFSFDFLKWMVLPAYVGTSAVNRAVACGILLIVTSSFFNGGLGAVLMDTLPAGLQLQGGLVAVVALVFVVAFVAAFLVERTRREMLIDEAPAVFDEVLGEAIAAHDAAHKPEPALEARCAQIAQGGGLTPRESEILLLTARGHSSTYIAEQLVVSASTVRFHQKNIYRKLDVHDRQSLLELVNGAG